MKIEVKRMLGEHYRNIKGTSEEHQGNDERMLGERYGNIKGTSEEQWE